MDADANAQHDHEMEAEASPPPSFRSRMSINELCNAPSSEDHMDTIVDDDDTMDADADVVAVSDAEMAAAAAALGHLRRGNAGEVAMEDDEQVPGGDDFITRVANIPLVKSTIRFYDKSKANSRVVKYGAEMVESSVKTISQPVLNRLEPQLGQLDEFACRQLDKFQGSSTPTRDMSGIPTGYSNEPDGLRRRAIANDTRTGGEDLGEGSQHDMAVAPPFTNTMVAAEQMPQRSRWQKILVEAGTAAGAGAAALSEEGMRSLKYCLEWLSYAVRHIEHQIFLLRSFIASVKADEAGGDGNANHAGSSSNAVAHPDPSTLAAIKREVVETLRKVVEVIGRYAGACLPGDARHTVRTFILGLPGRWASLSSDMSAASSVTSSPCQSPLLTPTTPPSLMMPSGVHQRLSPVDSANRVFALATESLLMLKSVAGVFGETKDRAETLVDRLRSMGYSPGGDLDAQVSAELLASRLETVARQNAAAYHVQGMTNDYFMPAQPQTHMHMPYAYAEPHLQHQHQVQPNGPHNSEAPMEL